MQALAKKLDVQIGEAIGSHSLTGFGNGFTGGDAEFSENIMDFILINTVSNLTRY